MPTTSTFSNKGDQRSARQSARVLSTEFVVVPLAGREAWLGGARVNKIDKSVVLVGNEFDRLEIAERADRIEEFLVGDAVGHLADEDRARWADHFAR